MDENFVDKIKKQHLDNYYRAIIDTITNNTNVLVEDDIMSLIKKPPLDSMDVLKNKFLFLAKKYKMVINTEKLDNNLDKFRKNIKKDCLKIKDMRIDNLTDIIDHKKRDDGDLIVLYKKDFLSINRKIRKYMKDAMLMRLEKNVVDNCRCIFQDDVSIQTSSKYVEEICKYVKGLYIKQFMDNFDIKVLVKETTLINSIKEQSDRYLFTINNSRLLNELE